MAYLTSEQKIFVFVCFFVCVYRVDNHISLIYGKCTLIVEANSLLAQKKNCY